MKLDLLNYELPEELIAQKPTDQRDQSRLMVVRLSSDRIEHHLTCDLPSLLSPNDLLVFNDTRVLPARFYATRSSTGGKVEGLFIEGRSEDRWHVMLKSGGKLTIDERLIFTETDYLTLVEKHDDGTWTVAKHSDLSTEALLDKVGSMPLPPYIRKQREVDDQETDQYDRQRYQTVFARNTGAVAAPTAGLHFTENMLAAFKEKNIQSAHVTLHVGMGTFAPVRVDDLDDHEMHYETVHISAKTQQQLEAAQNQNQRIIAVGTTSVRAIESLPVGHPVDKAYSTSTNLLIQPGYEFKRLTGLMTNFHLPKSTLLALVAAITGTERLMALYQVAIEEKYRFYSYGDAMLILP